MTSTERVDAHFSAVDVRVDDLHNDAWKRASPIVVAHYWSGETAPQTRQAEVRLIWTSKALLARFICNQSEPLVVNSNPQTKTKTLGLWDRDVCELFVIPDLTRTHHYFEFEAAPTGEWVDLALEKTSDGRKTDWEFASGMTTANRVLAEKLTITIRVPWSQSVPLPAKGDEWSINLCRCIGSGETRGYLAWQPTRTEKPNFHAPEMFGRLRFV